MRLRAFAFSDVAGMAGRRCRRFSAAWSLLSVEAEIPAMEDRAREGLTVLKGRIGAPLSGPNQFDPVWAIIDIEDGWQPKPLKGERYIVVPADEVPALRSRAPFHLRKFADDAAVILNGGGTVAEGWCRACRGYTWAVIDTQDGFQPAPAPTSSSAVVAPTDAEIVAAFERYQRNEVAPVALDEHGRIGLLKVGEQFLSMTEVRAAWSRELKRRIEEKARASRLPVRGDWAEDGENL